jgi:hypothetical protein
VSDRVGLLGTFCALTPIADEDALRAELAGWKDSPFSDVPGTHFARFVVLPPGLRREDVAQPPESLPGAQLMFSAFFDGEPQLFLEALCARIPDAAHAVWRHCHGHPGHPGTHGHAFRRWLRSHHVIATQPFADVPDATLFDVREALAFRRRFRDFAFARPGSPGREAFVAFAREQP